MLDSLHLTVEYNPNRLCRLLFSDGDNNALLTCALTVPQRAKPQQKVVAKSHSNEPPRVALPAARSEPVRILYTGKLLGYFRDPDAQSPDRDSQVCGDKGKNPSLAAQKFREAIRENQLNDVILVGMGDNFAPEVEARKFCLSPADESSKRLFKRDGKEFFEWDGNQWQSHRHGKDYIPDDNVASFFIDEGYAAIVPGKHDFYYGAERLRELAWLLAPAKKQNANTIHTDGVQMLASNLVIKTAWKTGHEVLSDRKRPPWFIPRFPTAGDLAKPTDIEIKLSGISDGGSVYPWFQGPSFTFSKPDKVLDDAMRRSKFSLCPAIGDGDPNAIPDPSKPPCTGLDSPTPSDGGKTYQLHFPWQPTANWLTLLPGKNYALCVDAPVADHSLKDKKGGHNFCVRFSSYIPLLQYSPPGLDCGDPKAPNCRMPKPFVLLEDPSHLGKDVAIFGVIDPRLPDYVGVLNTSWANIIGDYKTSAAVEDPKEALKEMDDYFEQTFREQHPGKEFDGIKILLAQMSPDAAEVLATRVGRYQVVVSEADAERATYDQVTNLAWRAEQRKGAAAKTEKHPAKFLAIPEPFYDEKRKDRDGSPWIVDIGSLTIYLPKAQGGSWHLRETHFGKPVDYGSRAAPHFWDAVQRRVAQNCLPQTVIGNTPKEEQIEWLTLCAMQDSVGADIALLQRRDFFPTLPGDAQDLVDDVDKTTDPTLQQIVERIIWKGDFLIVSHVPGSVIQKIMVQSKVYDSDDKASLSLSDEKNRGLLYVGIHYDDEQKEYLVNGVPLDPNKLYSVVTSDFVSGGDTGYPDLASAQANPPVTPQDLGKELLKISSAVCGKLAGSKHRAAIDCLDSIHGKDYFDEIALTPRNTKSVNTPIEALKSWNFFHHPGPVPGDPSQLTALPTPSASVAADKTVEQRPLWDFALTKWTLGITALGHSQTDYDVQNSFSGVSAAGVSAVRSSTWSSDMQAQYARNWQHNQILLIPAYTFNTQYKGQADDARQINQQTDLGMFDLAGVHLWNGRGPEHFDTVLSAHFETPLARIFNAFTLASTHLGQHGETIKDQLRFAQDHSYTELLRPGLRWLRRKSSIEIGPEWGHEWNALEGFTFTTAGTSTTCLATATVSISQCVKNAVKANPSSITAASEVASLRAGHNHSGMYWKLNLTVPFHPIVSYVFTDTGDWFFVHFHTDNSTDTRFRDVEQHQLKLTLFPSLSIGPEVDLLFYENASAGNLGGRFLRQDQVMMKAQFNFDVFNYRKLRQQLKYAPALGSK
jgi:5'-nucleotidase-like protein